ncbi:MAG: alpha/beta fold hydrolase [Anaerolineae bacterium]
MNLSAYNSIQSAADVAALREALGYDEWNLFGVSYGTRLALATIRDNPTGVRSVILDSTYPPQVNDQEEASSDEVTTFSVLFNGCAADSVCNDAYPDLENVFYQTVDQLNSQPGEYVATDPATGEESDATLSGDGLVEALYQAMYVTGNIPYLPAMIYAVSEGDYGLLDDINSGAILDSEKARVNAAAGRAERRCRRHVQLGHVQRGNPVQRL